VCLSSERIPSVKFSLKKPSARVDPIHASHGAAELREALCTNFRRAQLQALPCINSVISLRLGADLELQLEDWRSLRPNLQAAPGPFAYY
jgi:hypothetical protein